MNVCVFLCVVCVCVCVFLRVYINKLRLQILEALHIKTKKLDLIELIIKKWQSFEMPLFFLFWYFLIIFYFRR